LTGKKSLSKIRLTILNRKALQLPYSSLESYKKKKNFLQIPKEVIGQHPLFVSNSIFFAILLLKEGTPN